MQLNQWILGLAAAAMFAACSDDGGAGPGSDADRGGPDALDGVSWSMAQSANGIDFDFRFEFGPTSLTASNTCTAGGESLTANVEVPVKYRYNASIPAGKRSGGDECFVEITAGAFDFELAGDTLIATSGDSVIEFAAAGAHSGLYGDWTATVDGFTLTWSMGAGKIDARASCPGVSDSPSVSVAADFVNYVDVLTADEDVVGDEAFSCQLAVMQALMEYRFEGDELILSFNGQDTRLTPE